MSGRYCDGSIGMTSLVPLFDVTNLLVERVRCRWPSADVQDSILIALEFSLS